jgi:two-component system sensor histidine kinase MprB
MTAPATGPSSGSSVPHSTPLPVSTPSPSSATLDEPRWHYRRSLASRVILMTTMAVCFAVALVALGAYVTVKMSLENSLDNSLIDRAHAIADSGIRR